MVQIYTRTTCAPCKAVKQFLANQGVAYEELNVDNDPRLMDEVIRRTGFMMVPAIRINDEYVSGANFRKIASLLQA